MVIRVHCDNQYSNSFIYWMAYMHEAPNVARWLSLLPIQESVQRPALKGASPTPVGIRTSHIQN